MVPWPTSSFKALTMNEVMTEKNPVLRRSTNYSQST